MKIFSRANLAAVALTLFFNVLAVTEARSQIVNEVLKRMDAHQKALSSLRAKVWMEKYNLQLDESDISGGTAIYLRVAENQAAARIDWTKPVNESLYFINGQYVFYRPGVRQAIVGKIDDARANARLMSPFSFLRMSKKEIKANYSIEYVGQETVNKTAAWHMIFTPKKAVLYKSADLWIDGSGMPVMTKVLESNMDTTAVLLSDFRKNEKFSFAELRINLPKGTKIIQVYASGCPCFAPDNAKDVLSNWSDAVFSGQVTGVKGADYTFKIDRTWKDITADEVTVRNYAAENSCPIKLTVGERYVIFARKAQVGGRTWLELMPCSLTGDLKSDNGQKILKELGPGKSVKKTIVRKKKRSLKRR